MVDHKNTEKDAPNASAATTSFNKICDEFFGGLPETALFHYTSYDSLIKILESKSLWLTDYRHLNDRQELKEFELWLSFELTRRLERYVNQYKSKNMLATVMGSGPDVQLHKDVTSLQEFQKWVNWRFGQESNATFIGSFSEEGNLLSQWRGYCQFGKGVSIGFLPDQLLTCARSASLRFGRCIYDADSKRKLAKAVLDVVIEFCRQKGGSPLGWNPGGKTDYFDELESGLLTIASLVKHHAFAEEREWRIVSYPDALSANSTVSFRPGRISLVPFIKFNLPLHSSGKVYVDQIYLGPTSDEDLAFRSLVPFLRGMSHCRSISRTRSPYLG